MAGEECVLSCQGDRADQVFDGVGVHLDAAVVEEGLQAAPLAVDVGQLLAEARLGRDTQTLCLQPITELGHEGRAAGLTGRQTLARAQAPDLGLDAVELSDPAQAPGGDFRAVAVEDLLQLAPRLGW